MSKTERKNPYENIRPSFGRRTPKIMVRDISGNVYARDFISNCGNLNPDLFIDVRDINEVCTFIYGWMAAGRKFPFTCFKGMTYRQGLLLLIHLTQKMPELIKTGELNQLVKYTIFDTPKNKKEMVKEAIEILKTKPYSFGVVENSFKYNTSLKPIRYEEDYI